MTKSYNKHYSLLLVSLTLTLAGLFHPSQAKAVTITSPQTYDCGGKTVTNIVVSETNNVTIQNCTISGSSGRGISIDDSSYVTIRNVTITKVGPQSGAISINASENNGDNTPTHHIVIEDYHAIGAGSMGWAIGGSQWPIRDITVRRALLENVGNEGAVQTHGIYASNWQTFTLEDVTIDNSWNTGLKLVGDTFGGTMNRVVIKNSGKSGTGSGPAVSLDDGRNSNIRDMKFTNCVMANSTNLAMWIQPGSKAYNITVDHCTFYNNIGAFLLFQTSDKNYNWRVTNNIVFQDAAYTDDWSSSKPPLGIDGSESSMKNNFFDYNNYYFKNGSGTSNPIKVNGGTISLDSWKQKLVNVVVDTDNVQVHPDEHSKSINPPFKSTDPTSPLFLQLNPGPLCTAGQNGTHLGAYPCGTAGGSLPSPSPLPSPAPYSVWLQNYRKSVSGPQNGDYNNSGFVDGVDYVIWALSNGN